MSSQKTKSVPFVMRIECNDMENSVDSTFDDAYQNGCDSYILNSSYCF